MQSMHLQAAAQDDNMQDGYFLNRHSTRATLGAVMGWIALAGGLLAVAVYMNIHPVTAARWVTLAGTPDRPDIDFLELELDAGAAPARERTVRLRINRSVTARGVTGIAYRSFDGHASVDCVAQQARYTRGTYYRSPNFEGVPVVHDFASPDQPPVRLLGFKEGAPQRMVRLACR